MPAPEAYFSKYGSDDGEYMRPMPMHMPRDPIEGGAPHHLWGGASSHTGGGARSHVRGDAEARLEPGARQMRDYGDEVRMHGWTEVYRSLSNPNMNCEYLLW